MSVPFSAINRRFGKRGLVIRFWLLAAILGWPGIARSSSPQFPATPEFEYRVKRSQQILTALFLEQRYLHEEAIRIWKALPASSIVVADHIYRNELFTREPTVSDPIPGSAPSLKMAVLYLKWRNRWQQAYQLLQSRSDLVSEAPELQMIQILLALYTRNYEDAEKQLELMNSAGAGENLQLLILQYWHCLLVGRRDEAAGILSEMEQKAFYVPSSLSLVDLAGYPQEPIKRAVKKALTRFPSDTALLEAAVALLQRHDDAEILDSIINAGSDADINRVPWTIRVAADFERGRIKQAKLLLAGFRDTAGNSLDYLNWSARIACAEQNRSELELIARRLLSLYPFLSDGRLWLEICRQPSAGK